MLARSRLGLVLSVLYAVSLGCCASYAQDQAAPAPKKIAIRAGRLIDGEE